MKKLHETLFFISIALLVSLQSNAQELLKIRGISGKIEINRIYYPSGVTNTLSPKDTLYLGKGVHALCLSEETAIELTSGSYTFSELVAQLEGQPSFLESFLDIFFFQPINPDKDPIIGALARGAIHFYEQAYYPKDDFQVRADTITLFIDEEKIKIDGEISVVDINTLDTVLVSSSNKVVLSELNRGSYVWTYFMVGKKESKDIRQQYRNTFTVLGKIERNEINDEIIKLRSQMIDFSAETREILVKHYCNYKKWQYLP